MIAIQLYEARIARFNWNTFDVILKETKTNLESAGLDYG